MNMKTLEPAEPSAVLAQQAIADEFSFFSDWSERYQYLIDLGRKLAPMDTSLRIEANRLHGCQSNVWIVSDGDAQCLQFTAVSDSAIVSGLIHLALRVFSGRSASEIVATDADYITRIGLSQHLSPTRSNGLSALIAFIKQQAQAALTS